MELYRIFLASKAIETVLKLNLPYNKTMKLMDIREKMKLPAELYINEEGKLIDRFKKAGKLKQVGNQVDFSVSEDRASDEANAKEYVNLINELRLSPVEWCSEMVDISKKEMEDPDKAGEYQRICGECVGQLKEFVEFGGD